MDYKTIKSLTIKNFRFWILFAGVIFFVTAKIILIFTYKKPSCPIFPEKGIICDSYGPDNYSMMLFFVDMLASLSLLFISVSFILYLLYFRRNLLSLPKGH